MIWVIIPIAAILILCTIIALAEKDKPEKQNSWRDYKGWDNKPKKSSKCSECGVLIYTKNKEPEQDTCIDCWNKKEQHEK